MLSYKYVRIFQQKIKKNSHQNLTILRGPTVSFLISSITQNLRLPREVEAVASELTTGGGPASVNDLDVDVVGW